MRRVEVCKWVSMLPAVLAAALAIGAEKPAALTPHYALDVGWPKLPLPNKWALGLINGIFVDAHDHLWLFHSPELLPAYVTGAARSPPASKCCVPAPPIIEFDAAGNVLRAWGGPGSGYDWPSSGHGLFVDYKGNLWIGGQPDRARRGW